MKKRIQRRNPVSQLDTLQEWSLISGSWKNAFESKLQRRAAWYAHRERLIEEAAAHIPGSRPWAFWEHEHPEFSLSAGVEWEYLVQNDLLLDGELGGILGNWTRLLELTWRCIADDPKALKTWRRQAKLLGKPAQDALKRITKQAPQMV